MGDDFDEQTNLPSSNRDQSCAFCGRSHPRLIHPLDAAHARFRVYGKGRTLPHFWAVCERCEDLVASANDDELLRLMLSEDPDVLSAQAALAAFRAADLGAAPLPDPS